MLLTLAYWAGLILAAGVLGLIISAFFTAVRDEFVDARKGPTWFDYCVLTVCWAGLAFLGSAFIPVEWVSVSGFVAVIAGISTLVL